MSSDKAAASCSKVGRSVASLITGAAPADDDGISGVRGEFERKEILKTGFQLRKDNALR